MGDTKSKEKEKEQQVYLDQVTFGESLFNVPPEKMQDPIYSIQGGIHTQHGRGTGFLISPDLVLSSAHVVWNFKLQTQKPEIYFLFGGQVFQIQSIGISKKYQEGRSSQPTDDYALLKLKGKVPLKQFLPLGFGLFKDKIPSQVEQLSLFGIPQNNWIRQSGVADNISSLKTSLSGLTIISQSFQSRIVKIQFDMGKLKHKISTLPGQSGSPLIARIGNKYLIIGIHKGSKNVQNCQINVALLFNEDLLFNIKQSQSQLHFQPFTCYNVSWNPCWNPKDTSQYFHIHDSTIIRGKLQSEERKEIRSFNKRQVLIKHKKLKVSFSNLVYSQYPSWIKFGVVFQTFKEEKSIYLTSIRDTNKKNGMIKYGSIKIEPPQLFVKQDQKVDLLISLQSKRVIFIKGQSEYEISLSEEHFETVPDIYIFAQIKYQGDSLTLTQ